MKAQAYAVIMAGGKGTRFWPLSRSRRPKQLLKILGQKSLIKETFERIAPVFARENILVVTATDHFSEMRKELSALPRINFLLEPQGNNTAPCIGLAAIELQARHPDAIMTVLPADHWVSDARSFARTVQAAMRLAQRHDALITIGIPPSYPETGYGYILKGKPVRSPRVISAYEVRGFKEKPARKKALECIKSGALWNSGIFVWRASTILELLRRFAPSLFESLMRIRKEAHGGGLGTPGVRLQAILKREYRKMPSVSIDNAVLEKAGSMGKVLTLTAKFGWSDIGNWAALYQLLPHDKKGIAAIGSCFGLDSTNCLAYSHRRLVVLLGMKETVVVDSPDALLVSDMKRAQDIRELVRQLEQKGYRRYITK
jgi:mannose-1-phosphate guanylyltransferase